MNGGLSQYARMLDASQGQLETNPFLPPQVLTTPHDVDRQERRNDDLGSQGGSMPVGPPHHSATPYYEDELSDETIAAIAKWSEAIRWASVIICGVLLPVICSCIAAT